MRKKHLIGCLVLAVLIIGGVTSVVSAKLSLSDWYDVGWSYRRPVNISNPCGEAVTDYQVQVTLDGSFDFSKALSDGSNMVQLSELADHMRILAELRRVVLEKCS